MGKRINILHVDDSEAIISLLQIMLKGAENIECIEGATTLARAKDAIDKKPFDVIVLDIHLPDGNGISFLKWIKQQHTHIAVVMLTNHSDDYFRSLTQKGGADYFFDKSIEFKQAVHAIKELSDSYMKDENLYVPVTVEEVRKGK